MSRTGATTGSNIYICLNDFAPRRPRHRRGEGFIHGKAASGVGHPGDRNLAYRDSVTICLLTADLIDAPLLRVRIEPAAANGLRQVSDVMADKILTVPRSAVSPKPFGRLTAIDLARVDTALRFWLGL